MSKLHVKKLRIRIKKFDASKKVKAMSRQQRAVARKKMITESMAFQMWWNARSTLRPIPSDPYRAFMIDIALYAKPHHQEVWKHRTNRLDYPPVDFPKGFPRKRRRLPPRKDIKRFKKIPKAAQKRKLTPAEKSVVQEVEQFNLKYHLPETRVVFQEKVSGGAQYVHSVFGGIPAMILLPSPLIAGMEKGKGWKQQAEGTIFHELGHHAHVAYGYSIPTTSPLSKAIPKAYYSVSRKEKEKIAWGVARRHIEREKETGWTPVMGWSKKTFLGTYLGTTPFMQVVPEDYQVPKMPQIPKRYRVPSQKKKTGKKGSLLWT